MAALGAAVRLPSAVRSQSDHPYPRLPHHGYNRGHIANMTKFHWPAMAQLQFAADTGFPMNKETEERVALYWQGQVSNVKGDGTGEFQFFRVPYATLHTATASFADSCRIGGGGSCDVYEAEVYGCKVAVKALTEHEAGDGSRASMLERKQFMQEMSLLTTIHHANICRLLGLSIDGPQRCLVLEYCDGGSLYHVLKGEGSRSQLTWRHRLQIVVGIARALVFLHSQNQIHRDVKTQNVLLTRKPDVSIADMLSATKVRWGSKE